MKLDELKLSESNWLTRLLRVVIGVTSVRLISLVLVIPVILGIIRGWFNDN